jgi:hypothetical protein
VGGEAFGPIAPWRWLQQATALLRAHPRTIAGATAQLLAVALSPSIVQLGLASASPQLAQVLALLLSLLLYPPAVGGYFRVLDALAQGRGDAPPTLFAIFGDARAVRRLVLCNLVFASGALLVVSLLAWALGGDALMAFLQQLSTLKPGATKLPPLPPGALPLVVSLLLFGAGLVSAQGLAYVELALAERAPLAAIAAALRATLRNYGVLLLFYIPVAVLGFLVFMLVALAAVLLGSLLSLLSTALAPIVVLACGLLLALAMYALLFTFFYFAWRELFGQPPPPAAPVHEIAA